MPMRLKSELYKKEQEQTKIKYGNSFLELNECVFIKNIISFIT